MLVAGNQVTEMEEDRQNGDFEQEQRNGPLNELVQEPQPQPELAQEPEEEQRPVKLYTMACSYEEMVSECVECGENKVLDLH